MWWQQTGLAFLGGGESGTSEFLWRFVRWDGTRSDEAVDSESGGALRMAETPTPMMTSGTTRVLAGLQPDDDVFVAAYDPSNTPEEVDDPAGPAMVLVPFTAAHSGYLTPLAKALAQRNCPALTVDLPGHGRSGGT